jgi:hypothetical protein
VGHSSVTCAPVIRIILLGLPVPGLRKYAFVAGAMPADQDLSAADFGHSFKRRVWGAS